MSRKHGLTLLILLSSCTSQDATTEITPGAWRAGRDPVMEWILSYNELSRVLDKWMSNKSLQ